MTIPGRSVLLAAAAGAVFSAAAVASALLPTVATADTQLITNCPQVTETGGVIMGDTVTECPNNGSYELNAAPQEPDFPYEWGEPFYGPGLIIGGGVPEPEPRGGPR